MAHNHYSEYGFLGTHLRKIIQHTARPMMKEALQRPQQHSNILKASKITPEWQRAKPMEWWKKRAYDAVPIEHKEMQIEEGLQ